MLTLIDAHMAQNLATSAALLAGAAAARRIAARRLGEGRRVLSPMERRRVLLARGIIMGSLTIGLVIVWHDELQTLVLSLTAVLVALVVATKELIQCSTGALLRGTQATFRVGDRIELGGVSGEVVDRSLLTTTLLEVCDATFGYGFTGRKLIVPNVQLFAGATKVQRFGRDFVFHRIEVIFEPCPGVTEAMHVWQSEAARLCRPFAAEAATHHRAIEHSLGASLGVATPKTRLSTTELGKIVLEAVLFCPTAEAASLEVRLKTAFLDWLSARATIASFSRRLDSANVNTSGAAALVA